MSKFGEKLKSARINAGVSQVHLADFLAVSKSFLCGVENGEKPLSYTRVKKCEEFFKKKGVDVDLTSIAEAELIERWRSKHEGN